MDTYFGFILAALALTGSPGPNTLSLAAVGAAFGRRRGLPYLVGLTFGMLIVIAITGSGVSGLLLAIPGAAPVITLIAGTYFFYLAFRIATAPPLSKDARAGQEPKWFEGVILSLLNPKAHAAMTALFSGFVLMDGERLLDGALKALLLVVVISAVNVCWLYAGSALTPLLVKPKTSRRINIAFALLLVLSVIGAALI